MSELIEGHVRHLRAAGRSPRTIRARVSVVGLFERHLGRSVLTATPADLEEWLGQQDWLPWTLYTYWEHLRGFFAWAVSRDRLSHNPMDKLTRPKHPCDEPRPATEEQLAIALALPRPWRTAIALAAYEGLRAAEIADLDRADITHEWLAVSRKGGTAQLLPVHELVWAEVRDLPPGPLVRTPRGRAFSPAYLSASVSAALAEAGLKPLTLHWFRHRFGTVMLLAKEYGGVGADIRTVQEVMGHASVLTTQAYLLVTSMQRRAAIAALPVPAGVR